MIDVTTWCSIDIKSAVSLSKILEEINDEKINIKVNKIIGQFNKMTKSLQDIKNPGTKQNIMLLVKNDTIKTILKNKFPNLVESHLCNVVSTVYKLRI